MALNKVFIPVIADIIYGYYHPLHDVQRVLMKDVNFEITDLKHACREVYFTFRDYTPLHLEGKGFVVGRGVKNNLNNYRLAKKYCYCYCCDQYMVSHMMVRYCSCKINPDHDPYESNVRHYTVVKKGQMLYELIEGHPPARRHPTPEWYIALKLTRHQKH